MTIDRETLVHQLADTTVWTADQWRALIKRSATGSRFEPGPDWREVQEGEVAGTRREGEQIETCVWSDRGVYIRWWVRA